MTFVIGQIVATSARHALIVLVVALGLAAGALIYSAQHFGMTTDTAELISTSHEWRQRELSYESAFPSLQKLTIVVIDGATPELADYAAGRLASELKSQPTLFQGVRRPDGGAFFDRNGLLFLPLDGVKATTEDLVRSQSLLSALAADPSLRGTLAFLTTMLQGVQYGQAKLADAAPLMNALAATFEKALAREPAFFSWQTLMAGAPAGSRQTRRIILYQPVMDYKALQPGAEASNAVRATARALGFDAAHGVGVHLTGPVPLGDEEFGSLAEDWHLVAAAMVLALLVILWLAVRSARVVCAILATTLIGLIVTAAVGLLATHRFNLISVAFIPLFVGLGIDFSIQLSVRFLAEQRFHPDRHSALLAAGRGVGLALALAATAIGVGFFAFAPTTYIGVAELGTIAGLGMVIAFILSITLLPALLSLLRPPAGGEEAGYSSLAPVEAFLGRNRRAVLATGFVTALLSAAVLPFVRFDFNPLHLKSPMVESMATLENLMSDPDWTPNTISILAPSLPAAEPVVRRVEALPEVVRAVTLQSLVPLQQTEKLVLIRGAAERLAPLLGVEPNAAPSDEDVVRTMANAASALQQAASGDETDSGRAAARLAQSLDRLRQGASDIRKAAANAVVMPLNIMLGQIRLLLEAREVTIESMPPDIVTDWIAKDGRARIQVFPRSGQESDDALWRFAQAVQKIAPDATGVPISIRAAGESVVAAFLQAGAYSAVVITLILAVSLRRLRDVVLTMLPVLLSGLLTFASCAVLDLPLNFANIIALPLLFGIGVAFNIYFVMAWRAGETAPLQSSLMRAVIFSALTTATAFGALWLSSHPGTASMGRLLMLSLGWELVVTLLFRPALLSRPASPARVGPRQ